MVETVHQRVRCADPQKYQCEHRRVEECLRVADNTGASAAGGGGTGAVEAAEFGEQKHSVEDKEEEGQQDEARAGFLDVVVMVVVVAVGWWVGEFDACCGPQGDATDGKDVDEDLDDEAEGANGAGGRGEGVVGGLVKGAGLWKRWLMEVVTVGGLGYLR